ncbi:MAG: hypothetical protein WBA12_16050 [Catalinimonas sp.]
MFDDLDEDPPVSEEFLRFMADMQSGAIGSVVNDRPGKAPDQRVLTVDVDGKLYRMEITADKVQYLTVYESMEAYLDGEEPIDEMAFDDEDDE